MKHIVYERFPLGNKRFNWRQKEFILPTFAAIGPRVVGDPKEVLDRNIQFRMQRRSRLPASTVLPSNSDYR